jgi:hypothetical protein
MRHAKDFGFYISLAFYVSDINQKKGVEPEPESDKV